MFYAPKKAMENDKVKSAPLNIGWTRIGPWPPWLKMGTMPGNLLCIAQGAKLRDIDSLPEDIRARIREDYSE